MPPPTLFTEGARPDSVVSGPAIIVPADPPVVSPAGQPRPVGNAAVQTSVVAQLPADPTAPSRADIEAQYGWVRRPAAGWPVPDHIVAAVLGIPGPVFAQMLSESPPPVAEDVAQPAPTDAPVVVDIVTPGAAT